MDKIGASTNPSTWYSPGAIFLLLIPKVKKKCINFFVVIHSWSVSNANTTEKRSPFKKPSTKEHHAVAHQRYRAFLPDYKPKRIQGCLWLSSRKCKVKIICGLVALPCLATEVKNLRVAWIFLFTFVSFKNRPRTSEIFPSRSNNNSSSYRTDFNQKYVGKTQGIRSGTTSGNRRNNPHPFEVVYG